MAAGLPHGEGTIGLCCAYRLRRDTIFITHLWRNIFTYKITLNEAKTSDDGNLLLNRVRIGKRVWSAPKLEMYVLRWCLCPCQRAFKAWIDVEILLEKVSLQVA